MVGSVSLSLFLYLSLYRSLLRCFFITLHRVGLYLSRYNLCLLGEGRCELLTPIQFFFASLLLSIETLSTVNEFAPPSQAVVCVLRARFHARGVEVGHRGRLPKQPFFLIRFAFFFFLSLFLSLFFLFLYIRDISISRSLLSMTSLGSQSFHVLFSAGFTGCLGYVDAAPSSIPRIPTGTQRLPRRSLTMEASSQFAGKNHRSSRKWCLWQHENAPIIVHEIFHN